ncbi:MAG: molybdate ABC transporter substrate-binding protein [Nitrospinaceae bacterium]
MFPVIFVLGLDSGAAGGEVRAAVAANFFNPLKAIAVAFEKQTRHRVDIISGSTGKLYAQVTHGAPFDLLLAADSRRPRLLVKKGFAVPGSRFTYAVGRLTLWSPDPGRIAGKGPSVLRENHFNHLAMANPKTAPYGKAALQTLRKLGIWEQVGRRVVRGENIGQAFQFVASGNAELGFVALSQVLDPKHKEKGSRWDVPPSFHDPIVQDMVLLKPGRSNPAARAFAKFIRGSIAREIITGYGYSLE